MLSSPTVMNNIFIKTLIVVLAVNNKRWISD